VLGLLGEIRMEQKVLRRLRILGDDRYAWVGIRGRIGNKRGTHFVILDENGEPFECVSHPDRCSRAELKRVKDRLDGKA
jgi:hypothetical protein